MMRSVPCARDCEMRSYRFAPAETVPWPAALLSIPLPESRYPTFRWAAQRQKEERLDEAGLYRRKGELLLKSQSQSLASGAQSLESEVESCFRQALEVARRQQAKSFQLRAAISLARLWQHQGKRDDARQLLARVYGRFTEGFDTADMQEARALLDELRGACPEAERGR